MLHRRMQILRWTAGLVAAVCCSWASASDPPAFRAPAKPLPVELPGEPPAPEPAGPLRLEEALALALMRNPALVGFSWEVRASEARALQAGKAPNPELDVRVYRLAEQNMVEDVQRTRVVLSQVLELGGKPGRRNALAETERAIANRDYEIARDRVAAAVTRRFVAVVGAQRRVESHALAVEFFEDIRDKVQSLVGSGTVRSLDGHQVQRQAGLARIELNRAESELGAARYRLASTWGNTSPTFTEVVGELEQVYEIPELDRVLRLAQESPAAARRQAEVARGEAALSLAKAGRVPDLNLGVGTRWEDGRNDPDYLVDIEIALPIFDTNKGNVREAHYNLAAARAGKASARTRRSHQATRSAASRPSR